MATHLLDLPDEILLDILKHTGDARAVSLAAGTCRQLWRLRDKALCGFCSRSLVLPDAAAPYLVRVEALQSGVVFICINGHCWDQPRLSAGDTYCVKVATGGVPTTVTTGSRNPACRLVVAGSGLPMLEPVGAIYSNGAAVVRVCNEHIVTPRPDGTAELLLNRELVHLRLTRPGLRWAQLVADGVVVGASVALCPGMVCLDLPCLNVSRVDRLEVRLRGGPKNNTPLAVCGVTLNYMFQSSLRLAS